MILDTTFVQSFHVVMNAQLAWCVFDNLYSDTIPDGILHKEFTELMY